MTARKTLRDLLAAFAIGVITAVSLLSTSAAIADEMPAELPTAYEVSDAGIVPYSMTERVISYDEEYTCPNGYSAHYYFHRNYKDLVFQHTYSLDRIIPASQPYRGCTCGWGTLKSWTYYYSIS